MNKSLFLLMLAAVIFVAGCSKNTRVGGKVTFSDGSPVTFGTVVFTTGQNFGTGAIGSDGTYVMGSTKEKNGLPPGTYKVYLEGTDEITTTPGADPKAPPTITSKQRVAKEFTQPGNTPLSCEVKGSTVFDFKVEKPQ